MPRYRCSGPPDWQCEIHPLGEYPDFETCREACRPIDPEKEKRGARSVFRKHPAGVRPGPMASEWWGCLADRVWLRQNKPSRLVSRPKIPHKKQEGKTPHQKCPCEAFTMCDKRYQTFDVQTRAKWKVFVKNKPMSGYGLWMKECLCCLIRGYNFPDQPSASGGYSCALIIPGADPPPLEGFIGQHKPRYRCTGRPDWTCEISPQGAYETLEACQAVCKPPYKWLCTGPPDWDCVPDPGGRWETEEECLNICHPPVNYCNRCEPGIPDTLTVTLAGLGGDLAMFEGDTTVQWAYECTWLSAEFLPHVQLRFTPRLEWAVTATVRDSCQKLWHGQSMMLCEPRGVYDEWECYDTECAGACNASEGAVCTVSLFGPDGD